MMMKGLSFSTCIQLIFIESFWNYNIQVTRQYTKLSPRFHQANQMQDDITF